MRGALTSWLQPRHYLYFFFYQSLEHLLKNFDHPDEVAVAPVTAGIIQGPTVFHFYIKHTLADILEINSRTDS